MLDHYMFGSISRTSPEAPVPIVDVTEAKDQLGGAANVMNNLVRLGADVWGFGVIGDDVPGETLSKLILENGIDNTNITIEDSRRTTVKSRIIVGHQQLLRFDYESEHEISTVTQNKLLSGLREVIPKADIVVISDYDKGVLVRPLVKSILKCAGDHEVRTLVDSKVPNPTHYSGADIFKVNKDSAVRMLVAQDVASLGVVELCRRVSKLVKARSIVLTLGEDGMVALSEGQYVQFPAIRSAVYDVTGAGDTVSAVLAKAICVGYPLAMACKLANIAASIKVSKFGTYPVSRSELRLGVH